MLKAYCRVGGYNKGETNRFNLDVSLYSASCAPGAGSSVIVKGGMYIHQQDRNPKHRLRSN